MLCTKVPYEKDKKDKKVGRLKFQGLCPREAEGPEKSKVIIVIFDAHQSNIQHIITHEIRLDFLFLIHSSYSMIPIESVANISLFD